MHYADSGLMSSFLLGRTAQAVTKATAFRFFARQKEPHLASGGGWNFSAWGDQPVELDLAPSFLDFYVALSLLRAAAPIIVLHLAPPLQLGVSLQTLGGVRRDQCHNSVLPRLKAIKS